MIQFLYQQKKIYLVIISLTILLTGCVSQQQIVFLENAEWLAVQTLTLSAEDQQDQNPIITDWIDVYQWVHNRPDTESVFKTIPGENGSVTYLLVVRATGYNTLEETLLGLNRSITFKLVGGERQITIAEQQVFEVSNEGDDWGLGDDVGGQVRIIGGRIIDSDATRVENGTTAIWDVGPFFNAPSDPIPLNVTLTEVKNFSPDMIVLTRPPANVEAAMREALNIVMPPTETTTPPALSAPEPTPSTEVAEPAPATIAEPTGEAEIVTNSEDNTAAPATTDRTLPNSGAIITQANSPLILLFATVLLFGLIGAGILTVRQH